MHRLASHSTVGVPSFTHHIQDNPRISTHKSLASAWIGLIPKQRLQCVGKPTAGRRHECHAWLDIVLKTVLGGCVTTVSTHLRSEHLIIGLLTPTGLILQPHSFVARLMQLPCSAVPHNKSHPSVWHTTRQSLPLWLAAVYRQDAQYRAGQ